jgi:glucokinase
MMLLGIDIGGTAIKMGAVAPDGTILARLQRPFHPAEDFDDLLSAIREGCVELERQCGARARAVGICLPGFVDSGEGRLIDGGANIVSLRGRPLAQITSTRLGLPVSIVNDGVAAATSEIRFGAGRRFRRLVMLTLGTGVGGCVAIDGNVLTGASGAPPEVGAITLADGGPARAGSRPGSLESYACAAGFLAAYREAGGKDAIADVKDMFDRLHVDEAAAAAIDRVARRIAQALGSLVNALALDGCIIGGGIAAAGDALIARVVAQMPDFTWPLLLRGVTVVPAAYGNDAGFLGAAALAHDHLAPVSSCRPLT